MGGQRKRERECHKALMGGEERYLQSRKWSPHIRWRKPIPSRDVFALRTDPPCSYAALIGTEVVEGQGGGKEQRRRAICLHGQTSACVSSHAQASPRPSWENTTKRTPEVMGLREQSRVRNSYRHLLNHFLPPGRGHTCVPFDHPQYHACDLFMSYMSRCGTPSPPPSR